MGCFMSIWKFEVSCSALLLLTLLVTPFSASAGGFRLPEASVAGIGLSDALVANPDEPGAIPYNSAAMAFHEGTTVAVEGIAIVPVFEVKPDSPNISAETIESNHEAVSFVPALYASQQFSDHLWIGLHVGVPFGLATEWPEETFSYFDAIGGPVAGQHPTKSSIEMVAVSPSVALKLGESSSISAGLDYYNVFNVEQHAIGADVEGDGDGFGWSIALLTEQEEWSFGISYHSAATIEINGEVLSDLGGTLPEITRISGETEFTLPWRLQVGIRRQIGEKLALEFDIERIGWSEYDKVSLVATDVLSPGTVISTGHNHWRDIFNFRLGASYRLTGNTKLRFGTGLEKTPVKKRYFDARTPDSDRYMVSLGLEHLTDDGWGLNVGYMYGWTKSRDFSGRSYPAQLAGGETDPNGTDAYNGRYQGDVHLFGLGVTKSF